MSGTCRAGCGTPLDACLVEPDGTGIHPTCVQDPRPVLPELAVLLGRHQAASARSRQERIGPSEIGVECDRQLAYRLHGRPLHKDEALRWAPLVGTWGHAGIAEALDAYNVSIGRERYLIENRVSVSAGLRISGVTDCFDIDRQEVIDWKFVGANMLKHYRAHGPSALYVTQAHLYGRGWANEGMTPRSVRLVFLPRASHRIEDGYEWAGPYDPELADQALARLAHIEVLGPALGLTPDGGPWSLVGAQMGDWCRFCPWRRPGREADASGCPGDSVQRLEDAARQFKRALLD